MTEDKYLEIKDGYVNNIKKYIAEEGNIFPHLTIFANPKDNPEENAIIHVPIESKFMASEETKEHFMKEVVPTLAIELKKKFIPKGVAWTSEAWVRVFDKEEGVSKDWKSKPIKKEVLIINIEFEYKKEFLLFEIKRHGKQVNEEGNLTDYVELVEEDFSGAESMSGRFTNLYQKIIADK